MSGSPQGETLTSPVASLVGIAAAQISFQAAVNSCTSGDAAEQIAGDGATSGAVDYGNGEAGIMDMNHIGKFEMREILNEFDATLIRLFGVNMLDAAISRYEALETYSTVRCPRKAAELSGLRLGLKNQVA
jgi:hypothetical protein